MTAGSIVLSDGTQVPVRPLQRSDGSAYRRLISRLSKDSRYSRFLHVISSLSEEETRHFLDVDGASRLAIVALNPQAAQEIIAVARFDREVDSSRAEVAIVVDDAWQNRGLGSALIRLLVQKARDRGVTRLVANILVSNARSLSLFHGLHLTERSRLHDGVIELEMLLDAEDEGPTT